MHAFHDELLSSGAVKPEIKIKYIVQYFSHKNRVKIALSFSASWVKAANESNTQNLVWKTTISCSYLKYPKWQMLTLGDSKDGEGFKFRHFNTVN